MELIFCCVKERDDLTVNIIKQEIEKATKHLNSEMDEAADEFYKKKKDKEKDDYEM